MVGSSGTRPAALVIHVTVEPSVLKAGTKTLPSGSGVVCRLWGAATYCVLPEDERPVCEGVARQRNDVHRLETGLA